MNIPVVDLIVIIAYLVAITVIGIWVGYRKNASSKQYFLAGRSLGWFTVGGAMFASNISTIHLVGLAAAGASVGVVMGNFEWMACYCLIALALFFAPFYFRSGIQTLPQFLERRYSPAARTFLAAIAIFGALLVHIGISLYAGAKVFEAFLGVSMMSSILIISAVTVIYTVLGGLKAVVVTETIQTFLLLGGAVLITVLAIKALPEVGVNNYSDFKTEVANAEVWRTAYEAGPAEEEGQAGSEDKKSGADSKSVEPEIVSPEIPVPENPSANAKASEKPKSLSMIHPIRKDDGTLNEFSWLAILLGYPVLGIWYWCSDQTIVQRVLGSKSERDGQNGAIFAGFLKILPLFLMVVPGVIALVLAKNGVMEEFGYKDNGDVDYDTTLPNLINLLIPTGLKGLIAAGLLAALMSTIASALNSCATLISFDILKRLKPESPDQSLVKVGRISAGVIMVLAMLWSTQGEQFGTIFEAINKIPMIFAPAVTTVLVLGVFWTRGNNKAAISTFIVGCTLGLIYFVLDMPNVGGMLLSETPDDFKGLVSDPRVGPGIPFMLAGPILCAICVVTYVIVSFSTPPPPAAQLENACWGSPLKALANGKFTGLTDPRTLSVLLFALMVVLYIFLK